MDLPPDRPMNLILRLIGDKLRDRTTYVLALFVGTLINL
jgi:hypothetical protein